MSLKIQKFILFIPIINFVTVFCFLAMCFKKGIGFKEYLTILLKLFGTVIALTIPRMVVSFTCDNYMLNQILLWVTIYFYFFAISWILIRAQENLYAKGRKTGGTETGEGGVS